MRRPRLFFILLLVWLLAAVRVYGIEVLSPMPENGSTGNPINSEISFQIAGESDTTAVDIESIEINVNDTTYYWNSAAVSYEYDGLLSYTFYIVHPSTYGDHIVVTVSASDIQGTPMYDFTWEFWIQTDNIAPQVRNPNPARNATEVPLDTNILFELTDNISGVQLSTVSVNIQTSESNINQTFSIGPNLWYITASNVHYFTLDPPTSFTVGDTVRVEIHADDYAGNTRTDIYQFFVISSYPYTYVGYHSPDSGEQGVSVNTLIEFDIYNYLPGVYVDSTSILVSTTANGQQQIYSHNNFDIEPIYNTHSVNIGYQVTILPYHPFNYNTLVTVLINATATDSIPMSPYSYNFRTINDVIPPSISAWDPHDVQTDVPVDTDIYFQIKDLRSGVDTTSVQVMIDSVMYDPTHDSFVYGDVPDGYSVTITPPPFGSEQLVNISITGADNLGNTVYNSYSFTTEITSADSTAPFLWDINPDNGAVNIPLSGEYISFYVFDSDPGVDMSTIRLRKNGVNVTSSATIVADDAFGLSSTGYHIAYHVTYPIIESTPGVVTWSVRASDMIGNTYNQDFDEIFSFTCVGSAPPYINLPNEFIFLEDHTLIVDFADFAGDPDGTFPTLTYLPVNNIGISINANIVTFSAPLNWNGTEVVTFTVSDGSGGQASDVVTVTVLPVNDAPTIDLPDAGFTLVEDIPQMFNFSGYVNDPDGDAMILTATGQSSVIISISAMNVTISALPDWFGTEQVTFTVYDNASRLSDSETIPITFTSIDEPPVLTLPAVFLIVEDGSDTIDFAQYIYEPEGQEVILGVALANQVDVDIDGTIVTFTPAANWHGDDAMRFSVDDGTSMVNGNTIVRVVSVNDAPTMTLPASVSVNEDAVLVLDFSSYVNDVDGDDIFLSHSGNVNVGVTIDSMQVTLTPIANWNGTETIGMIATDPYGAVVFAGLHVNVIPQNDAPTINLPPEITFVEDTELDVDLSNYIVDIDGDDLLINITGNDNISYQLTGFNLHLSAPADWVGMEQFFFNVSDTQIDVDGSVQVRVTSDNDAPVVNLPASINFDEDGLLQINFTDSLYITDIDGDAITILPSGNNQIRIQVVEDVVIFTAEENWNGSEDITFLADDGHGGLSSGIMTVIVNPVNDAPTINLPGGFTYPEETTLEVNMGQFLNDVDLYDENSIEELTLSCTGDENVTVDINDMQVTFGSLPDWHGFEDITFTVSDFEGAEASDIVRITVFISQNNHIPELYLVADQSFYEDGELIVDFVGDSLVVDIDGDELLISVLGNTHILAEEDGALVTFTADEDWYGSEVISFFADDQNGGIVQGQLEITVLPVDDVPVFTLPDFFDFQEGTNRVVNLNDYVIEVDDDDLSMEFTGNSNIVIQDVGNLVVNMLVMGAWTGQETVFFTIDDGTTAVMDSVQVIVTQGTWNHAPQFIGLPASFTFPEDEQLQIDLEPYIFDLDADDEFIITVGNNSNVLYQISGLIVTLSALPNWYGSETLHFMVYDTQASGGRAHADAYPNIIVTPVNDAPTLNLPPYMTFIEDGELIVDFSSYTNDVDGGTPVLNSPGGENIFISILGSNVTFTATPDWFGSEYIMFTATDGGGLEATDSLNIIVTEGMWNNPPVITGLPDSVEFEEDGQYVLDFNPYVTDEDGDEWLVTFGYNQYINPTVVDNVVSFRSVSNWFGQTTIGFTIYELRSRVTVPGEIDVFVSPVNDAPVINLPTEITMGENEDPYLPFTGYLSDIDSTILTLSVTGNDTISIVIIAGNVVHFTPPANWHGTETVTFTVTDDSLASSSDVVDIVVEQGNFNHAPVIILPAEISTDEDTPLMVDFSAYVSDVDGDQLILVSDNSENMAIVIDGLEVTFTPVLNWHGYEDIDFTVYDTSGSRLSATDEVRVRVLTVNDAPELDLPELFSYDENATLVVNFSYYLFDADGDFLTITWAGNSQVHISNNAYQVTLSAAPDWSGSEIVHFTVTDGQQATATDSVEIIVNAGQFNHPPEIVLPDTLSFDEDTATEFNFGSYISDEDGDGLILTAGYNANMAIEIVDSLVTFRPALNYFGSQIITFTVYDTGGGRASASDDVLVTVNPVNDPPTLNLPNRFTFSNADILLVDFAPFMYDPDGETLTITYSGNDEITVNIAYPSVIFSTTDEFSGSENIQFTVMDGNGDSASDIVIVQAVSGSVNTPPEITLPAQFTTAEDEVFEVDFEAEGYISDIDEDPLSLLVYGNIHLYVEIEGTNVTLTPELNWNGTEELIFYVFDDGDGRATAWDNVNVVVTPVNDAPVINLPVNFGFVENEELNNVMISNYISDVDEDEITLSYTGSGNVIVDINYYGNAILADFSAVAGFTGPDTLTFTADDGELTGSDDIVIIVEPGNFNHPPVMNLPANVSIAEDSQYDADFSLYITDADDDDIVLTVGSVSNMDILINELAVTIIPDANWHGNSNITFTAYDTQTRASATDVMIFTVRPRNDAPVINLPAHLEFEENSSLNVNFGLYMQDVDGDFLDISWTGNENINISSAGYMVTFSEIDFTGSEMITFTVTDDSLATGTDIVEVEVLPGQWNHPPTIELPDNFTIYEDESQQFNFGPYIDDTDETDLLIITADYNPNILVSVADTLVTLIPSLNFNGSTILTFRVIDNVIDREIASDEVVIIVNPRNDAPTINLPAELSLTQEEVLFENFSYFINDVDGDALLLTCSGEEHLDVTITGGFFVTITPLDNEWFGDEILTFTVTDDSLASASDDMVIRVYQGSMNTPPEIDLPAEITFAEDGEFFVDFLAAGYISDAENDELFISVSGDHFVNVEIDGSEVTFSAAADWFGTEELLFYVFDDMGRSTASDNIDIIVSPVNDAPVVNLPISFIYTEDDLPVLFSLNSYIHDVDSGILELSVSGNVNLQINVVPETFVINISAPASWVGTEVVTFTVMDDSLASGSDQVNIIINPGQENHAPTLTLPDQFLLTEDNPSIINFADYIEDLDGDDIVITTGLYNNLAITINQIYVTITPSANYFGNQVVQFTIYDTQGRASDTDDVTVIVQARNDAPTINLPPSFTFEENAQLTVNFGSYLTDVDGDILSISWLPAVDINITNLGYQVYFEGPPGWYGSEMVYFTVMDDSLAAASDSVEVIVEQGNWNHEPVLTLPPSWTMHEDTQLVLDFTPWIFDIDGDELQISAAYNQYVGIIIEGAAVTLVPDDNYFGTQNLTFRLMDNVGRLQVSDTVTLNVTPVNDAPVLNLPNYFGFTQLEQLYEDFNEYMSDIDNADPWIMPAAGNENIGVSINNNTEIVHFWLENDDWYGTEVIYFTIRDDSLATATDSVAVTIYQGSVNNPPQIVLPSFLTFTEDGDTTLDFEGLGYIWDDDGDNMTITVSNNTNVTVEILGTYVTLSALENWSGNETLTFYVIDEYNQANHDNVIVQVTAVNDAPVIDLPASGFSFQENTNYRVALNDFYSDVDDSGGFTLQYFGDDNVNVEILQGDPIFFLEFTAEPDWTGSDTLSFTIADDDGASDSDDVVIHVTVGNWNHPPVIELPASVSFLEDSEYVFNINDYISDQDDDDILIFPQESIHVSISLIDSIVTLTPDENWFGTETITFTIYDTDTGNRLSATDNMNVIVESVNDLPQFNLPAGIEFYENASYQLDLSLYAFDPDDAVLDFTYSGQDTITVNKIGYLVFLGAPDDWTGEEMITFTAIDDSLMTATDSVLVSVVLGNWNHAPEIILPDEVSFLEDESYIFDIDNYISDLDGDDLLIFPQESNHISIALSSGTLVTLTPDENWSGTETISFTIYDSEAGARLSASDNMLVTVEPVNDPPQFDLPGVVEFVESTSIQLDLRQFAYDPDDPVLTYGFSGNDTIIVSQNVFMITLEAPDGWTGEEMVSFTATDESLVTAADSILVRVLLGEFNHAPQIELPEEGFTFAEDTIVEIDFSPYISDPDGDNIVITNTPITQVAILVLGNIVRFTPAANYNGTVNITFTVIDNIDRLTASDNVNITVTPVNDPPTLTLPSEISLSRDIPRYVNFAPFISDIDAGDTHTLSYSGNENIAIGVTGLVVDFLSHWVGTEEITFTVIDDSLAEASENLTIVVYSGQANNDPVIDLPELISFNEDQIYPVDFNDFIDDDDGDELSLLVTGNSFISANIAPNEIVTFSAMTNWFGSENLTFIVSDGYSFSTDNLVVEVLPVNDPPTLSLPNGFTFGENTTMDIPFNLYMGDVDGDALDISVTGNDNVNVEIIVTTVRLTCSGWYGSEMLTFTVDDENGQTASDSVLITVTEGVLNHPPVINLPPSFAVEEDDVLHIDMTLYVSDVDEEQLYLWVNGTENTTVNIYGLDVYVIPADNWFGTETLTFTVIDNVVRETDSATTNIIVTPVNDDPVISLPQAGFSFDENHTLLLDFNQYVDDVDNDALSLVCTGNTNVTVQINSLSVNLGAVQWWSGTETLTFTVDDGNGGDAFDEILVTVNYINDAPYVLQVINDFTMPEDGIDTSINLHNVFSDHDLDFGDELTYSVYGDLHLQVTIAEGAVTIAPDANWFGQEMLTFRATDSEGLFVEEAVTVFVNSINDNPVVIVAPSLTAQADESGFAQVMLDANGSYDIDGDIVSVLWTWNSGSANGMITQQAFEPGYYAILVTATDDGGGIGTATTYLSVASYTNQIPVALDDYYQVYEESELVVFPVNGVLHNDYDPDSSPLPLEAVLITQPTSGTMIQFNPAGSFIYLAENITNHDVTFTYQAYDGQAYSLIRTVHITVHEIVLDDAVISVSSFDPGGATDIDISVPILTSELIADWDVRNFAFDLQFTSGVLNYTGFNLDDTIVDTNAVIQITESRGILHCTYTGDEIVTGEGALLNIEYHYYIGFSPFEISNFTYNQTAIGNTIKGAVNNAYPELAFPIVITGLMEDFEPFTLDLNDHFTDDNNDVLTYSIDFDEDEITAVITGSILELSSVSNWFDTTTLTVTATDNYTFTQPVIYPFDIVITGENDAPAIVLPDSFSFAEDTELVVNMFEYVSDPDYDDLILSWSGNTNIGVSAAGMNLTFTAAQDWYGTELITIQADDSDGGRLIAIDSLNVIVTPVNDPPVFGTLPPSIAFDEDETETVDFILEGYVSDPENNSIILSISNNVNIIATFEGAIAHLSAPENWNGNETVTFTARDDLDTLSVSADIQIIVHQVNDVPVIELPRDFLIAQNSLAEDNTMNFADSLWIYDVDGNILELTVNDGEFIDIVIVGSIVTFEPQPNWIGLERRTFTVNDNQGRATASDAVNIIVFQTSSNQPPLIELPVQGFSYPEDGQLTVNFSDYITDPEGDEIIYLDVNGSNNITALIQGMDVIFGTAPDFFGIDEVVVTAIDSQSGSASVDTLIITVTPVNDPPQIDLPDNIVLVGNTTRVINFEQYLRDIDNDVNDLELSAEGNEQINIEIFNTVVSFTAPAQWEGEETVYFSVIDAGAVPAQDSLIVIVEQEHINHPPVISLPASFTYNEDEELELDFSSYISDVDDDALLLTASGNQNIIITITGYNVLLRARENWNGSEIVIFTVYDTGTRAFDSEDVQINVTPVNDAPVFDPIYDIVMERDQVLEIDFGNYVSDLEDNVFHLTISAGEGVLIEQNTTVFTFTPEDDCPATQNLTLTATENVSDLFTDIMFGLFVMEPAVDLSAIDDAVKGGMFTFKEKSGEHTIDFSQFLNTDYDNLVLTSAVNNVITDSLDISITGYTIKFEPKSNWIGDIFIPFSITYLQNRARRDFEIKVSVRAERNGEYVEPRPHLVTWQWDHCDIIITTGEPMAGETCKILNRQGKLIRKLPIDDDIGSDGRFKATWYKDNEDGDPVNGGLYLYQVDIDGKLYQGSIIIAR
ncbi:MAG: tandem-95 repeat protein [Candidatus Cloacimonetes bacterium]|nr:tandem-95 repeat protein [Candidatus Cloacimonadota bacterium]